MTRFRGQKWDSSHERARARAAERLWEVLGAGEAEWLDRHLTDCPDCRAVAESYDAQRIELRGLRDRPPVPPRDLWARTAAAIEREDARRRPSLRPDPAPRIPILRRKRPSPVPLGAMAGALVVAVVVGVSLLGGRQMPPVLPPAGTPLTAETRPPVGTTAPNVTPAGTPIVVAAGDVGWMRYGPDGRFDVFFSRIDEVCADAQGPDCAPIDEASPRSGQVQAAPPKTVVMSPDDKTLVVVDGDGKVVVVPVPTAPGSTPAPTPRATPSPQVTPSPLITPAPPVETPTPPAETATPPVATPPAGSLDPSATPEVTATPTPTPIETATPTVPGGPVEIIADVIVVGQAAAYSPDGTWFAFSARPADGTQGPDIYVWRAGDAEALAITTDHRSVFSGWLGESVLGSRPALDPNATASPPPADAAVRPMAFLLDPATRAETALDAAPFWRPSVGPSGSWAIYWDGTLTLADNGFEWRPGTGALVLGVWPPVPAPTPEPPASELPVATEGPASETPVAESPAGSVDPSAVPPSGSPEPEPTPAQVIDSNPIRDWDARWDESGSHVAIWIADQTDPTIGRLSLYVVDPATGTIDLANPLLSAQPSLPGFSITSDRLAWATPDNQDGEGSHVEVLAWTKDDSGQVQSAPGEEQVVVIR